MDNRTSDRLTAFLAALPHALSDEFVNAPGLGTFRAKHVTAGLERGVLVVHWTGVGLAIVQPKSHGICRECADAKGRHAICDHCQCAMCAWFRIADERASPRADAMKIRELVLRLKTFEIGAALPPAAPPSLID